MIETRIGRHADIDTGATIGYENTDDAGPVIIADNATIRSGSIIYGDVRIGSEFSTGHDVVVREETTIGDGVTLGTKTVVDGSVEIGSNVSVQTGVYIPPGTTIGDNVFIGPRAVFTNDPYPVRQEVDLEGPTVEDHVSIGANATVLPSVTIGSGSFVAAGAVVDDDVPPDTLALGVPATHRALPDHLAAPNAIA